MNARGEVEKGMKAPATPEEAAARLGGGRQQVVIETEVVHERKRERRVVEEAIGRPFDPIPFGGDTLDEPSRARASLEDEHCLRIGEPAVERPATARPPTPPPITATCASRRPLSGVIGRPVGLGTPSQPAARAASSVSRARTRVRSAPPLNDSERTKVSMPRRRAPSA